MRDLKLVGLSEDGTRLVMQLPGGELFGLPVDERVHAALRGDRARLGQLQIELESRLRPRDIQARIRAGQSLEDVAAEAGISVERVQRYAGPVLQEREHIAQLAANAGVRHDDHGAVQLLGELVGQRLEQRGVPRAALAWDAWRRDDGGWVVRLDYEASGKARSAAWIYDSQRKTVVPDDDEARWLIEEEPQASVTTLRPVPSRVDAPVEVPADVAEVIGLIEDPAKGAVGYQHTAETSDAAKSDGSDEAAPAAKPKSRRKSSPAPTPEPPAPTTSRRKRATVPSWDEILFGSKKPD